MKEHAFVAAISCCAVTWSAAAECIDIAVRGKPAAYTIVIPEKAGAVEKYASGELQSFLERVTGVRLPVATDEKPLPEKAIILGETRHSLAALGCGFDPKALGSDGFRLAARPPHIVAYGSAKRGALYAAYEILETYAGCRWYASWHSVIPKREKVSIPADIDDVQIPAFEMRESYWYDINRHRDFSARLRLNGYNCTWGAVDAKYGGDSFRFGGGLGSCHTFNKLLPPDVHFDEHPEYFSLVKGKRLKNRTQLCLTNPDVLRIVTSNVLERIRKDPDAKFYGVSQNDWGNYCECERCAAVDAEEESHAGTVVRFVNAIAEAVEKEFPDAVIETLAYKYTRKPPKKTRLRRNVMPCLCSIECDFARPIPESPYAANKSFMKDICGWKTQTDRLYLWDYVTEFTFFTLPFPNVYALKGNLQFFRDNNVKEMFAEGAQMGRHAAFAELKGWLLAKLMWNPDREVEPLIADFFAGYYGKAAPFVRVYFEELHRIQRDWSADPKRPLRIYGGVTRRSLPDDFVARAKVLWMNAVAAVKDDPELSYNVRMSEFSFDTLRLERMNPKPVPQEVLFAPCPEDDARIAEAREIAKSLLDRMDEAKDISVSEERSRHDALVAGWKAIAAPDADTPVNAIETQCAELEERRLGLVKPGTYGAIVADPQAADGKAMKLFNTHFEWCTTLYMHKIKFRPGAEYKIRARVRVEKERDGGEAFWAGVYDDVQRKSVGFVSPRTDAVKDSEYAWYDVCSWTPRADGKEYFWIGPGRFGRDGKSNIKALYIDKIELSLSEKKPNEAFDKKKGRTCSRRK